MDKIIDELIQFIKLYSIDNQYSRYLSCNGDCIHFKIKHFDIYVSVKTKFLFFNQYNLSVVQVGCNSMSRFYTKRELFNRLNSFLTYMPIK